MINQTSFISKLFLIVLISSLDQIFLFKKIMLKAINWFGFCLLQEERKTVSV